MIYLIDAKKIRDGESLNLGNPCGDGDGENFFPELRLGDEVGDGFDKLGLGLGNTSSGESRPR